jgi:two-component system LytT family response regulator
MNIIIIESDQKDLELMSKQLRLFCPTISLIGCSCCYKKGLKIINSSDPDIVFVDYKVHDYLAAALAKSGELKNFLTVILSYDKASVKNTNLVKSKTIDFLLKPIDPNTLLEYVKKVRAKLKQEYFPEYVNQFKSPNQRSEKIGVPTLHGTRYISLKKIIYLRARSNYTEIIREEDKAILISKSLKSFEKILSETFFMRVHQSYLVNLEKVMEFQRDHGGMLVLSNESSIPVSRANKHKVKNRLKEIWKTI